MKIALIYIPCPSEEVVEKISHMLVQTRLAACTNSFPIKSMYFWEGKMAKEGEIVIIAKTLPSKYVAVQKAVKKVHPYKVPCIIKIESDSNKEYYDWIKSQVK